MALPVRRLLLGLTVLGTLCLVYFGSEYGLLSEGGEVEINKCTMTRMYPSYHKVSMDHESRFAGKYELHYYQDESIQRASAESLKTLSGVPLLFIPGNGGSRRQIRSIASTSARAHNASNSQATRIMSIEDLKRESQQLSINHFDFFSIDLGEELSAFNGGLLSDQSNFAASCVTAILKLYERSIPDPKYRPTSVILLGHSMGGVVARSIFFASTYKASTVRTILTLNSPHISAPLLFHRGVHSFYRKVNDLWRQHCDDNYELQQTAVVSIAGGLRDTQVHASLSNLDSIIPCKNHITAVTTSIPDVWISMDHTSCMWCHQLTTVISAALSGLLEASNRQVHPSLDFRLANLRHYFQSTVPASLHLDSPSPKPAPSTIRSFTKISRNDADSIISAEDKAYHNAPSTAPLPEIIPDSHNSEFISNIMEKAQSSESYGAQYLLPWVTSLPTESKKTTIRVSGWHKLTNFHIKWDLFEWAHLSHLQMLTTVPLDDLRVLLCNEAGTECLDLTKTAAPMPYTIRETRPHQWQTLKAHVLVTSLKDYSASDGYRFLVVSSVHKPHQYSHNSGVYKGEYGPEIFLVAQLTDPVDIITMNGNWMTESEYPLGQNLVSHLTLLDANKYHLYRARVIRNECNTHPLFTPLILAYSPAMGEERYELSDIALRFHEQYLSYNYRRSLQETLLDSKERIHMYSQEALHVFVFSDPICPHSILLQPDWAASIDVMFRNYGVLILGGFFVLSVMVAMIQLRHADDNPSQPYKKVVACIAYFLTSPWILLIITLYAVPVRFSDFFDSLSSNWLQSHSFVMMARPWPSLTACTMLIVTSLVALTAWSTVTSLLFYTIRVLPGVTREGFYYMTANSKSSAATAPNALPSLNGTSLHPMTVPTLHRRSPSIEMSTATWAGTWCFANPKIAIILFFLLTFVAIIFHSAIAVLIALLILTLPLSNDFPITSQQDDSMFHYRQVIFILYSPTLILLIPDMLVWINNMHFEYRIIDSYERFAISLALHVLLIKFTSPTVTLQRSSMKVHWLMVIFAAFMTLYCLFPLYRTIDALFFISLCFCFDHVFKVFSTPPHERFIKTH